MLDKPVRIFLFSWLLATPAGTQTGPGSGPAPAVEELVAEALTRSPTLAAARARLGAARELERPAGALPDPMVEAMLQNADFPRYTIGEEDMSMAGVEVRQALPYPGKRGARGETARAETGLRAAELVQLEHRAAAEVRTLYARIYLMDSELRALAPARELVDLMNATALSRYTAGETGQEAVLKAQLRLNRLEETADERQADRDALVAELNRWLDRAGSPLGEITALPPVAVPTEPWDELAVAAAPAIQVARAQIQAAEKRLAESRLDLKPDLSPAAGLAYRGPLGPVLTLRIGVELPFWKEHKQEPRIRAAELELERAHQELRDAEAGVRAEAARLGSEWRRTERQIQRYRDGILPQTSAAFDAARSSYLTGRGDFSAVVEDFDLWLEATVELARREADRYAAWAALESLIGTPVASPGQRDQGDLP